MYTDVKGCILLVTTYSERNVQSALIKLKAKLEYSLVKFLEHLKNESNFDAMLNRERMEI